MTDELKNLRAFAKDVMDYWPEEGADAADLEELARKHGLIEPCIVNEPCSETSSCACAEMGADFPTTCFRRTPLLLGAAAPDTRTRVLWNSSLALVGIAGVIAIADFLLSPHVFTHNDYQLISGMMFFAFALNLGASAKR